MSHLTFVLNMIQKKFRVGLEAYRKLARENLPVKLQEQALEEYFKSKEDEVSEMIGKRIDLVRQKLYTGTHNAGYTECRVSGILWRYYLKFREPLGKRIVVMLDVAVRDCG